MLVRVSWLVNSCPFNYGLIFIILFYFYFIYFLGLRAQFKPKLGSTNKASMAQGASSQLAAHHTSRPTAKPNGPVARHNSMQVCLFSHAPTPGPMRANLCACTSPRACQRPSASHCPCNHTNTHGRPCMPRASCEL